jgi:hypothetical protein
LIIQVDNLADNFNSTIWEENLEYGIHENITCHIKMSYLSFSQMQGKLMNQSHLISLNVYEYL